MPKKIASPKPRGGMQSDLFNGTSRARIYRNRATGRRPEPEPAGHIAPPGTGPEGKTCGDCTHCRVRAGRSRRFYKCGLAIAAWTHGRESDVRLSDAACRRFEAGEPSVSGVQ